MSDDAIPHGLKGYRPPYSCTCDVCRLAWNAYSRQKRIERNERKRVEAEKGMSDLDKLDNELARKRRSRAASPKPRKKRTESQDSVGAMERAVIEECATLDNPPKATQLVAAKSLASLIDRLNNESGGASVVNSATKQLMTLMSEIRGDTDKSKATGKRKSGGRLATVGAMTKVKRQGA